MLAVETRGLTKHFGSRHAVNDLSITVEQGEIFGLVGPDGAGKTTTMRLLTAILDATSGDAWVMGRDVRKEASSIHDSIGYMSQRFGLYPDLTVAENIDFYADLYGVDSRGRSAKIDELLAFSGMTPFKRRFARNLSGGMKQKLGLACALIHAPDVLFLDEPTNGVDPVSRRDFWRIIHHLVARDRVTIVVSTAYLDEAERCNRVAMLDHGHVVVCDTPAAIKDLVGGALVEVRTAEARKVAAFLRESFREAGVETFGDRVAIRSRDPQKTRDEIDLALRNGSMRFDEIRITEPSIESAFFSILKDRRQAGDAA